jgi:hypothetical protein
MIPIINKNLISLVIIITGLIKFMINSKTINLKIMDTVVEEEALVEEEVEIIITKEMEDLIEIMKITIATKENSEEEVEEEGEAVTMVAMIVMTEAKEVVMVEEEAEVITMVEVMSMMTKVKEVAMVEEEAEVIAMAEVMNMKTGLKVVATVEVEVEEEVIILAVEVIMKIE